MGDRWLFAWYLVAACTSLVATILLLAPAWGAEAGSTGGDSVKTKGSTLIPFPFYLYSPETKSGVGVLVTYFHRPPGATEDQKPSTYSANFVVTQRKQVVTGLG